MRPTILLLLYLVFVFLGGALLAPWLYFGVQNLATEYAQFKGLAGAPFHRYVNRSLIVLAVIGLFPLLRALGIRTWSEIGFSGKEKGRGWLVGFLLGFFSLAAVALIAVFAGAREMNLDHTTAEIWRSVRKAATAALIVSILEELIFRGGLYGGLRKTLSWKKALLLSSAVYALVHFFARPAPPASVDWSTGIVMLGRMLVGFVAVQTLIPAFLNLLLAGLILGIAFQWTRNLYMSIGLHAGWIFWLKSYGFLTREKPGANTWLWGTGKLIDGWIALAVLAVLFVVVWRWGAAKESTKHGQGMA